MLPLPNASSGTTGFRMAPSVDQGRTAQLVETIPPPELLRLFHRLNNQLGVILANAELLEARLTDETQRARASEVVSGAVEAITTIQHLRQHLFGLNGDRVAPRPPTSV